MLVLIPDEDRVMLSSIPTREFNHVMRDRDHAASASDATANQ